MLSYLRKVFFNKKALNEKNAIDIPERFALNGDIKKSVDILFQKTEKNKYFLTKSGINIYQSIHEDLTDLIYNEKKINEIFSSNEISNDDEGLGTHDNTKEREDLDEILKNFRKSTTASTPIGKEIFSPSLTTSQNNY